MKASAVHSEADYRIVKIFSGTQLVPTGEDEMSMEQAVKALEECDASEAQKKQ